MIFVYNDDDDDDDDDCVLFYVNTGLCFTQNK